MKTKCFPYISNRLAVLMSSSPWINSIPFWSRSRLRRPDLSYAPATALRIYLRSVICYSKWQEYRGSECSDRTRLFPARDPFCCHIQASDKRGTFAFWILRWVSETFSGRQLENIFRGHADSHWIHVENRFVLFLNAMEFYLVDFARWFCFIMACSQWRSETNVSCILSQ